MRSLRSLMVGVALLLAACSAQAGPAADASPTLSPAPQATFTPIPVDLTPAQRAAIATVAKSLGLPEEQLSIVSTEAVTWPNGCIGIQHIGMMCTMNEVPGFRIIVGAGGKQYEVHTNQDGSVAQPEQAMQAPGAAEKVAIKQLATNLGVSESDVTLVSDTPIEWPDSCLGVAQQGVMCAQMVTSGYLIVLEAAGKQYEYHTNQDGSTIQPATLALTWSEQGGIAGVCKSLTAYLSGEVYGQDCRAGGDGRMAVLQPEQRAQLNQWVDKLGQTSVDKSDPKGVSDGMTRQASLNGAGTEQASETDQTAIFDFAETLYKEMYP